MKDKQVTYHIGEIAEILGVTQKVVEYRIYTAFNILRRELDGFKI